MSEHLDTIVVGGGQAGLSTSWHLKKAGREHIILDRGKIGDTWRHRWDAFCLVTPNWTCNLPDFPYDGDDPDGFMLRDEIVDYVVRFAQSFDPPFHGGVEVHRVSFSRDGGRFSLDTSTGELTADNVIIATGTHQKPRIPAWADRLGNDIFQVHSYDYVNPEQIPDGAVLVVGGGQSGCQIVEDLFATGRDVHLSVGKGQRVPRRYRGKDFMEWSKITGLQEIPVEKHRLGPAVRFQKQPLASGRDGGRTINLRQFALDGIKLHGRLIEANEHQVSFGDDLAENLDAMDKICAERTAAIDKYIAENGIDAPENDLVAVDWQPTSDPATLDLRQAGIDSVIYGTGFYYDFGWLDFPIFDDRGYPRYKRGVTEVPGLYFIGLHWMHTQGSGLFSGVGHDAEYIVGQI